ESRKEKLTIKQLLTRIKTNKKVKEIILALNPNSEGNLTTYYIEKAIKTINPNIKITKLGRGLPQGGEVEFADAETLVNALEGRK
ncbi:MAG: toprim domain-containing protein, partial [Candidatus Paceibacterota bacterium]